MPPLPTCATHITTAEHHVLALFLGADRTTRCAGLQADEGFMLQCLRDPTAAQWSAQMHHAAQIGDAQAALTASRGWYKRLKLLVDAAVQTPEPTP